jgi:hypothetical protein
MHIYKRGTKPSHAIDGKGSACFCEPIPFVLRTAPPGVPQRAFLHAPLTIDDVIDAALD